MAHIKILIAVGMLFKNAWREACRNLVLAVSYSFGTIACLPKKIWRLRVQRQLRYAVPRLLSGIGMRTRGSVQSFP